MGIGSARVVVFATTSLLILAWTGRDFLFEGQTSVESHASDSGGYESLAHLSRLLHKSQLMPLPRTKGKAQFKVLKPATKADPKELQFLGGDFDRDIRTALKARSTKSQNLAKHKIFVYDLPYEFNGAMVNKEDMKEDLLSYGLASIGRDRIPKPKEDYRKMERLVHGLMQQQNPLLANASEAEEGKAALFFVPVYPVHHCAANEHKQIVRNLRAGRKLDVSNINFECGHWAQSFMLQAKDWVAQRYPFWNASGGSDHVFMSFYDFGPCMEHKVGKAARIGTPVELKSSIFLTLYGSHSNTTAVAQACSSSHDVVVAPLTAAAAFNPPHSRPQKKSIFVFFRGNTAEAQRGDHSQQLRLSLLQDLELPGTGGGVCKEAFKDNTRQCTVNNMSVISSNIFVSGPKYADEMRSARFCLAPPGFASWSFRFFEAVLAGCIPVVYDDGDTVLPYEDAIDYNLFIVRIPSKHAKRTLSILTKISQAEVQRMQEHGREVRGLLAYQRNLGKYGTSGFHPVLNELLKHVQ